MKIPKIVNEIMATGLESTVKRYGLKVDETDRLVCLNYDMLSSPRMSVADECRGLVLEKGTWKVVCRPFSRFYNYGEIETPVDIRHCVVREKLDGSLIKVFFYQDSWYWATRGLVKETTGFIPGGHSFADLMANVLNILGVADINDFAGKYHLEKAWTYLFELITPYNRVVVDYAGIYRFVYLGHIHNETNTHRTELKGYPDCAKVIDRDLSVNELENYQSAADKAGISQEGFVVYTPEHVPFCKIKSSLYVNFHHVRTNGDTTHKDVLCIILDGEEKEYLAYFKEDKPLFDDVNYVLNMLYNAYAIYEAAMKEQSMQAIGMPCKSAVPNTEVYKARYPRLYAVITTHPAFRVVFPTVLLAVKSGKCGGIRDYIRYKCTTASGLKHMDELIAEVIAPSAPQTGADI